MAGVTNISFHRGGLLARTRYHIYNLHALTIRIPQNVLVKEARNSKKMNLRWLCCVNAILILTQAKSETEWDVGMLMLSHQQQGEMKTTVENYQTNVTSKVTSRSAKKTSFSSQSKYVDDNDNATSKNIHPEAKSKGESNIHSIITGISCTVLLFVAFMPCAGKWDKYITRKLFGRTIYIAQHFDEDQSSHLSEIILRNSRDLEMDHDLARSRTGMDMDEESSEVSVACFALVYSFAHNYLRLWTACSLLLEISRRIMVIGFGKCST